MFSSILRRLRLPVSLFNLIIFLFSSHFNHLYLDIIMLARRFSDEIRRYYTSVAVAAWDLAVAHSTHLEIAALLAKVVTWEPRESLEAIYTGPQTTELIPRTSLRPCLMMRHTPTFCLAATRSPP